MSQRDVTRARAELAQAEASVLSSSAELAQAKIRLNYTEVRSPVAGKVDRNLVDLGNLVGQSQATLLTTMVQMDPLWVYFDLPDVDEGFPHEGHLDFLLNASCTARAGVRGPGAVRDAGTPIP